MTTIDLKDYARWLGPWEGHLPESARRGLLPAEAVPPAGAPPGVSEGYGTAAGAARAGLAGSTALSQGILAGVDPEAAPLDGSSAPRRGAELLRWLGGESETLLRRLPPAARGYVEALRPLAESAVEPLSAAGRQESVAGLSQALSGQLAVLRRLAAVGAPLEPLLAVARGQLGALRQAGLLPGEDLAYETQVLEEIAAERLRGRIGRDGGLLTAALGEQPEAAFLGAEALSALEDYRVAQARARTEAQGAAVLEGLVQGAAAGQSPPPEARVQLAEVGLGDAEGLDLVPVLEREAASVSAKRDPLALVQERYPPLKMLERMTGRGGLYRRAVVTAQRTVGVPEGEIRVWDRAETEAAVADFLALPPETAPGPERVTGVMGFARSYLAGLPPELQGYAVAELVRHGLLERDASALLGISRELAAGRSIAAQSLAGHWVEGRVIDGTTGKIVIDPATAGPPVVAQVLPLPGTGVAPPLPGTPSLTEALHQVERSLRQAEDERQAGLRHGAWAVSEAVAAGVAAGEATRIEIVPRDELVRDPAMLQLVDRLTLKGGMTWTEATAIVGELAPLARNGALPADLAAVAELYATVMPSGSGSRSEQEAAARQLGEFFQSLQAEGRITLAELALLKRSSIYAETSERGSAWVNDEHQVVGTWVEVLDDGQAVLANDDGLFLVSRGRGGRWEVEAVFDNDPLLQDRGQSDKKKKGKVDKEKNTENSGLGMPDPDEDPDDRNNKIVRTIDDSSRKIFYVEVIRNLNYRGAILGREHTRAEDSASDSVDFDMASFFSPPQSTRALRKLPGGDEGFNVAFRKWWTSTGKTLHESLPAQGVGRKISRSQSFIWSSLDYDKDGLKTNGLSGGDKRLFGWDFGGNNTHQTEIEVYDRFGRHLGAIDPITGEFIEHGDAEKDIDVSSIEFKPTFNIESGRSIG